MNLQYVYRSAQIGEFRPAVVWANGPASYSQATGDPVYPPAIVEYINAIWGCLTKSGNYRIDFYPTSAPAIRAGATNQPGQAQVPGWYALWQASGRQGIATAVQNAAGSGMTVGTVAPLTFSGTGHGAAGTFTVLTATTGTFTITNPGEGYTGTPTATVGATGGTPPTVTLTAAAASGVVADATNLSAEVIQTGCFVSQL